MRDRIEFHEAEAFVIPFALTYGNLFFPKPENPNTPLPKTALTTFYFSVKEKESDAEPFVEYEMGDANVIWDSESGGTFHIIMGEETLGHAKKNCPYELRLKMADGRMITAEADTLDILPSVVGVPEVTP